MNVEHLGMVIEEDGQILIAFKPETIELIAQALKITAGDIVVTQHGTDGEDGEPVVYIKKVKTEDK